MSLRCCWMHQVRHLRVYHKKCQHVKKIDMLLSSGLLDLTVEGSIGRLWLTDVGKGVVERVREIDGLMSAQKSGDQ